MEAADMCEIVEDKVLDESFLRDSFTMQGRIETADSLTNVDAYGVIVALESADSEEEDSDPDVPMKKGACLLSRLMPQPMGDQSVGDDLELPSSVVINVQHQQSSSCLPTFGVSTDLVFSLEVCILKTLSHDITVAYTKHNRTVNLDLEVIAVEFEENRVAKGIELCVHTSTKHVKQAGTISDCAIVEHFCGPNGNIVSLPHTIGSHIHAWVDTGQEQILPEFMLSLLGEPTKDNELLITHVKISIAMNPYHTVISLEWFVGNTLVKGLSESGIMNDAKSLLYSMLSTKPLFQPDVIKVNVQICQLHQESCLDMAVKIHTKLVENKSLANIRPFTVFLGAYIKASNLVTTLELWKLADMSNVVLSRCQQAYETAYDFICISYDSHGVTFLFGDDFRTYIWRFESDHISGNLSMFFIICSHFSTQHVGEPCSKVWDPGRQWCGNDYVSEILGHPGVTLFLDTPGGTTLVVCVWDPEISTRSKTDPCLTTPQYYVLAGYMNCLLFANEIDGLGISCVFVKAGGNATFRAESSIPSYFGFHSTTNYLTLVLVEKLRCIRRISRTKVMGLKSDEMLFWFARVNNVSAPRANYRGPLLEMLLGFHVLVYAVGALSNPHIVAHSCNDATFQWHLIYILHVWYQSWNLIALFTVHEMFGAAIISWKSMYNEAESPFFMYWWCPKTPTPAGVYYFLLSLLLLIHDIVLHQTMLELDNKRGYQQKFGSHIENFYNWQYLALASTSPYLFQPQGKSGDISAHVNSYSALILLCLNLEDKVLFQGGSIVVNGPEVLVASGLMDRTLRQKQPKTTSSVYIWDPGPTRNGLNRT